MEEKEWKKQDKIREKETRKYLREEKRVGDKLT